MCIPSVLLKWTGGPHVVIVAILSQGIWSVFCFSCKDKTSHNYCNDLWCILSPAPCGCWGYKIRPCVQWDLGVETKAAFLLPKPSGGDGTLALFQWLSCPPTQARTSLQAGGSKGFPGSPVLHVIPHSRFQIKTQMTEPHTSCCAVEMQLGNPSVFKGFLTLSPHSSGAHSTQVFVPISS